MLDNPVSVTAMQSSAAWSVIFGLADFKANYSLDDVSLDKFFKFKPTDTMYEVGDYLYLTVTNNSQFSNGPITFKDGTKSPVQKYLRTQ